MYVDPKTIENVLRKTIPNIRMAFLGGSQVVNDGANKVKGSDYDIVVMTGHTKHAHSYNHASIPHHSGATMDIIVRDAETLAFDMNDSKRLARGAIPNIIANGNIVFDDKGTAPELQSLMSAFLKNGPAPLSESDYAFHYEKLDKDIQAVQSLPPELRSLAAYEIAHQTGVLHLHQACQWHASGKLLGRFLLNEAPFKTQLEEASEAAIKMGDVTVFSDLLSQPTVSATVPPEPLLDLAESETDVKVKNNFYIRYSAQSLRDFCSQQTDHEAADNFIAAKSFTLVQALNPERIGRPSNEYFYALCRVVYNLSEFAEIKKNASANGDIGKRYESLLEVFPSIVNDVFAAKEGKEIPLKKTVKKFSKALSYKYNGPSMQTNPSTFRTENETLQQLML